ncbi:MAG: hypothetical protein M1828_005680 [Chrysothrix sp. TS-e1954]|nr:MAG: hypothetical protein M1828_005680 [Chrysothrix sp. TS-e1954]
MSARLSQKRQSQRTLPEFRGTTNLNFSQASADHGVATHRTVMLIELAGRDKTSVGTMHDISFLRLASAFASPQASCHVSRSTRTEELAEASCDPLFFWAVGAETMATNMDRSNGITAQVDAQDGLDAPLPILEVQKVDMQFAVAAEFVAAQVSNNVLILALQSGKIMRIDLDNPTDIDDIDLPKKASEVGVIRRMFLDPTASHLIISTTLGENFYLHMQSRIPKPLSRLKGVQIQCVSWNPSQPTASSREILVGAIDGTVYETFLELATGVYRKEDKYAKIVYRADSPICGIWTDVIPGSPDLRRVILAQPTRLLHFIGRLGRHGSEGSGSIYAKLFESEQPSVYDASQESSPSAPSALVVTPEAPETPVADASKPKRIFAWLSSQGVYHGKLLVTPASPELGDKLFAEARTLKTSELPTSGGMSNNEKGWASYVALTQWHIVQLVNNRIIATNRLDDSVIYDQAIFDTRQRPVALLADLKKNTFWLFTNREIFEVIVRDEDRDVWKVMLNAQRFEDALQYANNASQRDAIATASGDYLIAQEKYMEAAAVYGKSTKPFEEVALAFIDSKQKDALRKYLLTKLSALKKTSTMQRIMLTSWLVEIYMSALNAIDDTITTKAELISSEYSTTSDAQKQLKATSREFQDFVRRYKDDLDAKTVYDIISSHGREEELLYFSTTINDYNYILSYWVQRERWPEALKALNKQTDPEITYKYSTVLMAHRPVDFIDILTRQSNLEPRRLIPACLNYNRTTDDPLSKNQAARYLNFEISQHGCTDPAVHNTLLSIYASHPSTSSDEGSLLTYLQTHSPHTFTTSSSDSRSDPQKRLASLPYDADFALRLCTQHAHVRACAHIYTIMGQYISAVDLALSHQDTETAIAVAERPEHDQATRKKLWLAIARSVISGSTSLSKDDTTTTTTPKGLSHKRTPSAQPDASTSASISTALSLLKRAPDNTLQIEDILPLLPPFLYIDALKEPITAALATYTQNIETLQSEMDASAASAARIKAETAALRDRWVMVEPGEECAVCGEVLVSRRFWAWGCGHCIHASCVEEELTRHAARATVARLRELRGQLEGGGAEGARRKRLGRELDDLLGRECLLCGEFAVRMVDEPFVGKEEERSLRESWAL